MNYILKLCLLLVVLFGFSSNVYSSNKGGLNSLEVTEDQKMLSNRFYKIRPNLSLPLLKVVLKDETTLVMGNKENSPTHNSPLKTKRKKSQKPKKQTKLKRKKSHLIYEGVRKIKGLEDIYEDIEKNSQHGKTLVVCDFHGVINKHATPFVMKPRKIRVVHEMGSIIYKSTITLKDQMRMVHRKAAPKGEAVEVVKKIMKLDHVDFILASAWNNPSDVYKDLKDLGLRETFGIKKNTNKVYTKRNYKLGEEKVTTYSLGKHICSFRKQAGRSSYYHEKGYATLSILKNFNLFLPDGATLKPMDFKNKFKDVKKIIFVDDSAGNIKTFARNLLKMDSLGFFPSDIQYKNYLVGRSDN